MSKFTPGPWSTLDTKEKYYIFGKDGMEVVSINYPFQVCNAKLISKAPDMYEYIRNVSMVLKTVYDGRNSFAGMVEDYINQAQNLLKEIDGD